MQSEINSRNNKEIFPWKDLMKVGLEGLLHPVGFYRLGQSHLRDTKLNINAAERVYELSIMALTDIFKYTVYAMMFKDYVLPYILK